MHRKKTSVPQRIINIISIPFYNKKKKRVRAIPIRRLGIQIPIFFIVIAAVIIFFAYNSSDASYTGPHHTKKLGKPAMAVGIETEDDIYIFLRRVCGFNCEGACGVMGNISTECDFNKNDQTGSFYGLFQWSESRQANMGDWCYEHGLSEDTYDGQLNFFNYECKKEYSYTYKNMKNASDPETAAAIFCKYFEGAVGRTDESENAEKPDAMYEGEWYQQLGFRESEAERFYEKYSQYGNNYMQLASDTYQESAKMRQR